MKRRKPGILLLVVLMMLIVSTGLFAGGQGEKESAAVSRDTVTVVIPFPPVNLDANKYTTSSDYFTRGAINGFLFEHDRTGKIINAVAEKIWRSEDGLTAFVKIRPGIKFHDGSVVTADDVVFSYNRFTATPDGANLAAFCSVTLEKVDASTVSLKLNYPGVLAEECLAFAPIIPKAVVEADEEAFNKNPIGCGPYRFVSYENKEIITLEAFEGYFGKKPSIKNIKARVISDPSAAVIALEAGEVDVVYGVTGMDLKNLDSSPDFTVDRVPAVTTVLVGFMQGDAMNNKKLRQALFHGINREEALILGADGEGVISSNLYSDHNMQNLKGLVEYKNTYDLDLAKKLLKESGFDTSKTLKISTSNFFPTAQKAAQSVANNLKDLGINAEVETLDINTYFQKWMTGQIEIMVSEYGGISYNSLMFLVGYTTFGDMTGVMYNTSAKSEAFDALFNDAAWALTDEEQKKTGKALLQAMYDNYLVLPMFVPYVNVVFNADLSGVEPNMSLWSPNPQNWAFK